ncbi:MAG: BON domain-containing protein [Steroidobacteraceae bacterium]|jgi:osmotically-inducible protein OsmY
MSGRSRLSTLSCAIALTGVLSACAAFGNCGPEACADDAKITADVAASLHRYPAASPPNRVRVQTVNSVVYLTGQVDTDTERLTLIAAARAVEGVKRVVDSINLSDPGR